MYKEPFEGAYAEKQPKKILILGESHHDIRPEKTTKMVMAEYLAGAGSNTFQKIARAFGVDRKCARDEERALLWDKVFFGNYIDMSLDGPSGEEDRTAEKLIAANKDCCNQELAEFIQVHEIDVVFCFSVKVFDALPNQEGHWSRTLFQDVRHGKADLWFGRGYRPDSPFGREIKVYGAPHPRYWNYVGITPEELAQYTRPIFEECCRVL